MSPFLSIVLTGRNDGHGKDFRSRFFRTLGFNLRELAVCGVSCEVVFVEWAPTPGRPLLMDLVGADVPAASPDLFRGYVVDRRYQAALSLNPRLKYLEFIAKNVGIRRARGRFVLATNCDVFLGRHVLDLLRRELLAVRTLYRAPRHDLKASTELAEPTWDILEDPANLEVPAKALEAPFMAGGTGDFILLDRETFHELRGFNEVYRVARIGLDSNFVSKAISAGIPVVDIGGPVYHLNHGGSYRLDRHLYAGRENEAPWGNIRWHSRGVIYHNPDGWGLAAAPEVTLTSGMRQLDFTWGAVPPLVDLRRIILPVARVGGPDPWRYVPQSPRS